MRERWLHPIYLISLGILLLNDHWWKMAYGNLLTGKLSDIAGLLAFAWFFSCLFPTRSKAIFLATGIGFIWWKSIWATPFILHMQGWGIPVDRVVDPSDLWALAVLPIGYRIWMGLPTVCFPRPNWAILAVGGLSLVGFSATSLPYYYSGLPPGDVHLGLAKQIKGSPSQVLAILDEMDISYQAVVDSSELRPYYMDRHAPLYRIDTFITTYQDTLRNIHFSLHDYGDGTAHLRILNLTLPRAYDVQDWRHLRRVTKRFRRLLRRAVLKPVKQTAKDLP